MIITRSPLRIPIAGGGTDLPSYYREHSGFVISAAMDKYVYVTIHGRFSPRYLLKYLGAGGSQQRGRDSAPLDSRIHPAGGPRPALPRNHQHGRHSRRNRVGLVGQLYHGPAQGAAPAEKEPGFAQPTGRAGLPHRDRRVWASPSANRTSTSRPSAASTASAFSTTARSRLRPWR